MFHTTPMIPLRPLVSGLLVGLCAGAAGCPGSEPNPNHCVNNDGDAFCRSFYGDDRPFCTFDDDACPGGSTAERGCVADRPPDECWSPCGDRKTALEDATCEGVADGSGTIGTQSGGPESTDGGPGVTGDATMGPGGMTEGMTDEDGSTTVVLPDCFDDDDCTEADAPACVGGSCVPCGQAADPDAACASLGAGTDVCVPDVSGDMCVQCTEDNAVACTGTTPVCGAGGTCEGCRWHDQCEDTACRMATGECFDASEVMDVGMGQAFATIGAAMGMVGAGERAVLVLHAGLNFDEASTVDADRVVAFVAAQGDEPQWQNTMAASHTLRVNGGEAYVWRVRMATNSNNMNPALRVSSGPLYVHDAAVVNNNGGGVEVEAAGELFLVNSFVGGSQNSIAAVSVVGGGANILYSTLLAGFGMTARALSCSGGATVDVRNAIVLSESTSPAMSCLGASISTSAHDQALAGATNVGELDGNQGWFLNYGGGEFSLSPAGATVFADIAQWEATDPPFDIDGTDPRPSVAGTADYAGADVP